MKKCLRIAVFVVAASLVPLQATTVILPSPTVGALGSVMVDTSSLVITYDPATKLARLNGPLNSPGAWTLGIDLITNPDASVSYEVPGNNSTDAPMAFSFTFATPMLLGPYGRNSRQVNESLAHRDGDGATGAGVTQAALLNVSSVPAVALGSFTCAAFDCPDGQGFGSATSVVASASYTALAANVGFAASALDLPPINELAATANPEPASMVLTFLGLLLAPIGMRLRRKR
jgi:hypothetical protein